MKTTFALSAALLLAASPLLAQETGTSHPESINDAITTAPTAHYVKPSPAVPIVTEAPAAELTTSMPATAPAPVQMAQVQTITPVLHQHEAVPASGPYYPVVSEDVLEKPAIDPNDDNSGVVTEVASGPNELPANTLLKARLLHEISTKDSTQGSPFSAILTANMSKNGKILLPAGTIINGHIAEIRAGKHLGAAGAIRLQPDSVTLPDGLTYPLEAEVIDLDHFQDSRVSNEGTIVQNRHAGATAAALTLTTGSATVAGAMIAGAPGAVVGAGIGIGAGAIWWFKRDLQQTLPEDLRIVFSLDRPLTLNAK